MSHKIPETDHPQLLNPSQERAAKAPRNPLLIIAGAGTGKTLTLTHRLIHLIDSGATPESICGLTFTNKAAREILDRVLRYLPRQSLDTKHPFLGTFHSFGARILRAEHRLIPRSPHFVIFDDDDSLSILKKTIKSFNVAPKKLSPAALSQAISRIKNEIARAEDFAHLTHGDTEIITALYDAYEAALARNNALDFDDLISKVVRLFRAHPAVLEKYRAAYLHVLVDEYQDVNTMQYELIRLLAGEDVAARGSLSVVGDDHQMIYSWRGSSIDTFLRFDSHWPDAQTVVLDENYRSTGTILKAASAVIAQNTNQKPKTLWTKNGDGDLVKLLEAQSETQEAEWVARDVARLATNTPRESIGVLYRTNAQSRAIEQALIAHDIPYRIFGGVRFYERREIKDALAFLRYAWNPDDEISRGRLQKNLLKSRFFAVDALRRELPPSTTPETFLTLFVKRAEYFEYLSRNFPNAAERQENILSLIRFASEFQSTDAFLEQTALVQAHDEPRRAQDAERAQVALSTIHLAKGLEFDHVLLVGCAEGILPHARALEESRGIEEERRLMYVAMTRARQTLAISFYDLPSRFISEVPQELFLYRNLATGDTAFSDSEERYITLD